MNVTYASRKRSNSSRDNSQIESQHSFATDFTFDESDSQSSFASSGAQSFRGGSQEVQPQTKRKVCPPSRCKDAGDNQALTDEIEFALDGCGASLAAPVREKSAYSVLEMCQNPEALSVMRARGMSGRLCSALAASASSPTAQLVLSAAIYLVCQDELSGDEIAETVVPSISPLLTNAKAINDDMVLSALQKCAELPSPMTPRALAVRILSAVASTAPGRSALRTHGVLTTVSEQAVEEAAKGQRAELWWARQLLLLLEHATFSCPENQLHVAGALVPAAIKLLDICLGLLRKKQQEATETLQSVLRALMNVTNGVEEACKAVGPKGVATVLSVLAAPLPETDRFDASLHATGVLTNVVELSPDSASTIDLKTEKGRVSALDFLVGIFSSQTAAAGEASEKEEKQTQEAPSEGKDDTDVKEDTSAMEHVILAAYIALLLGCMVRSNQAAREAIKERLPGATFDPIIQMLSAFLQLHGSAGLLPPDSLRSFAEVVAALQTTR